jgi:hypothetical protein
MIEAWKPGQITPDKTTCRPTSAMALRLPSPRQRLQADLTMPTMSIRRRRSGLLGAELVLTEGRRDMKGAILQPRNWQPLPTPSFRSSSKTSQPDPSQDDG